MGQRRVTSSMPSRRREEVGGTNERERVEKERGSILPSAASHLDGESGGKGERRRRQGRVEGRTALGGRFNETAASEGCGESGGKRSGRRSRTRSRSRAKAEERSKGNSGRGTRSYFAIGGESPQRQRRRERREEVTEEVAGEDEVADEGGGTVKGEQWKRNEERPQ